MVENTDGKKYRAPVATGDYLVQMKPKLKTTNAVKELQNTSSLKVAVTSDYKSEKSISIESTDNNSILLFEKLNIAVVRTTEEGMPTTMRTKMSGSNDVHTMRPEFYMYAIGTQEDRYSAWVKEGLSILAEGFPASRAGVGGQVRSVSVQDTATWGLQAIQADISNFTGRGIKIAVLDTGFDLEHPDFEDRLVESRSFVRGESVQDGNGHGTHCIGTAAGPFNPSENIRYGVAHEANIFCGKVLSNSGSGRESGILAGMEWAITLGCEVISMSLGRPTSPGETFDPIYERVGQTALEQGALIIAAAGNESERQFNFVAPVGAPANSPSIMAVAAVNETMNIANFSCGGINPDGGEINIAAPGVDVLSSFPMPRRYARLPGTSMACPHVAGIAALLAQSDSSLRGSTLWDALRRSALDIGLPMKDAGSGLVQAPGTSVKLS